MGGVCLRPVKNSKTIEIPLTLDVQSSVKYLTKTKVQLGYLIAVAIVIAAVLVAIILRSVAGIVLALVVLFGGITLLRLVWFEEPRYKKNYDDLEEHNYVYDSLSFWEIYDVAEPYPICYYKSGLKAVFVMFDKDITIGRGVDGSYNHYEALTKAYRIMARNKVMCTHIDYMDSVGRDTRLESVVDNLMNKATNEHLRKMLATVFDYQQAQMNATYTTYDVYAFYFTGDDKFFRETLDSVLQAFLQANYVRYRLMDLDDLRLLATALYGLENFSAKVACDNVFNANDSLRKNLKVIGYTKGDEYVKVSKTVEELAQEAAIKAANKQNKKQAPKMRKTAKKAVGNNENEDVELW